MSLAPARRAALEVLHRVRERAAYGSPVLDAVLGSHRLSVEDTALATRLSYGVLAAEGTLDDALGRFVERPGKVEPLVGDALRLAAYELLFARTPSRAAVHQGVEAVRRARPEAAGFANAVLRRLAGAAPDFPWGDVATDPAALARGTAHPLWLVERFVTDLGWDAATESLRADDEPAPLYLRHNPFLGSFEDTFAILAEDGAEPEASDPAGCIVARVPRLAVAGRAVTEGRALVTDAAAQVAPEVVGGHPGGVVVDVASGRGTKTAHLQAVSVASGAPARLFALDSHDFKSKLLAKRMASLGVPGVTALSGDATALSEVPGLPRLGTADAVLLDAPCSGTGTLRRHPEKRWRISPERIGELAGLQSRLLAEVARLVRPGGVVVYSTCSLLVEENESVVAGFLRDESGSAFEVRPVGERVPSSMSRWITTEGFFRSRPTLGGMDGHFVAALERAGG